MEKDNKHNYEVIVVGGGPAGIATAITLYAKGIHCCVVEANKSPIRKSGEAIPPNAKPLLKQLGILDLVEDNKHKIYYGNKSCWGSDRLEQKEFISERLGHGYLLDRLYFEKQLQTLYKTTGASFYSGYKLKKVDSNINGIIAIIESDTERIKLQSKYIVDATGRKASVCRHLGIEKENLDSQFAIIFNAITESALPYQIFVEATKNGWWYVSPYAENEVTMMFFTLKKLIPDKENLETFIQKELDETTHLSKILKNITVDSIKIMPAGTSCLLKPYGENWLAVGDAAYSYDPISSYGITSALASGFYGGHAIADKINGKREALNVYRYIVEEAFQGYLSKLMTHYKEEKRWRSSYYWRHRMGSKVLVYKVLSY
ncbi:MAG: NAD(P)/FAD-dependent oxidoreductase [Algibacter sp.]